MNHSGYADNVESFLMCWYNGANNWLIPIQMQIHEYEK